MTDTKNLKVFCPRCRVPVVWQDNPYRPFCSEKCRLVDLGRWADEEYRIPVKSIDADELAGTDDLPREPDEED